MSTDTGRWQQLRGIFDQLVELPQPDQAEQLTRLAAGDESLRDEIAALLAAERTAGDRFDQPPVLPDDFMDDLPEDAMEGTRIGAYRVTREIGRGGMGAVYEAFRDDAAFTKRVAIKMVPSGRVTDLVLRRFHHERQILAQLEHKNIAALLDGGVTDGGRSYFAMEYVEGERIDRYCDRARLGIRDRVQLLRQVCAAVQYAHQHLVVHRDLKPSNVLVGPDGTVKLLDFGIAKLLEPGENDEQLTETGMLPMTTSYASPEQLRGGPVGTATDIYSLGVLMYELLAGRPPFLFANLPILEIRRRMLEETPLAPSLLATADSSTTGRVSRAMASELDHIVLMALRKEPERRYASADELSEDLLRFLSGLPIRARPDSFGYRARKFAVRNRVAVAAIGIVFVTLVAGLVVTLWQFRTSQHERAKTDVVTRFLQDVLLTSARNASGAGKTDGQQQALSDALGGASQRLASAEIASSPEVQATLEQIIGANYVSLGQYDEGEKHLRAALAIQTRLFGDDNLESLKTLLSLANLAFTKADYENAERFFRRRLTALRHEQRAGRISAATLMLALGDFALIRRARGDSEEAEAILREAMALGPQLPARDEETIGQTETLLVLALLDHGKFAEAEDYGRRLVTRFRQSPKSETPEMCSGLTILGSVMMEEGKLAEAEVNLKEAETLYRRLYDSNFVATYDNVRLQAQLNYLQGRLPEAAQRIEQSLDNYRQHASPKYISFATALTVKGLILNASGKPVEAERVLREAVRLRSENLPDKHFMSALTKGALGEVLMSQKRLAEAEPLLVASYDALKLSQAVENPRTGLARQRLVELYTAWHRPERIAALR